LGQSGTFLFRHQTLNMAQQRRLLPSNSA
jgi:hypothetical protein